MSRKDGKRKQLRFWLTGSKGEKVGDKNSPFTQLSVSLLTDPAFISLSIPARYLYACLTAEAGPERVFKFPRKTALRYGFPESSFFRYVKELEDRGFISRNSGKTTREPNIYQFEDIWKHNQPP